MDRKIFSTDGGLVGYYPLNLSLCSLPNVRFCPERHPKRRSIFRTPSKATFFGMEREDATKKKQSGKLHTRYEFYVRLLISKREECSRGIGRFILLKGYG